MGKKNYKLIKNKLCSIKVKILITLFLSFFCVQFSLSTDYIEVWPYEIKFNYETGHTNDAIEIKKDVDDDIPVPEWKYGDPVRSEKFAYIKSQSNRKIQVRFDSNCDSMHLLINLNISSGTGIGEICNYFVENYYKKDSIILTLEGSVPNSVDIRNFTWEWEIYAIPKDPLFCSYMNTYSTNHTFYTLYDTPQAPMAVPWTNVLDYACDWASGQSTAANVAQKVTEGIYYMGDMDGDIDYNSAPQYCVDFDKLRLSDFLDDVKSIENVRVNCTDCANLVNVFTAAVGCQAYNKWIGSGINTKEIDPIGSSFGWDTFYWNYHQYGWINDLVNDASLRLDRYGDPRVPTNMIEYFYYPLLIDGDPPEESDIYTTQIINY